MPWVGELSGRSSREEFGEIYSKCMMWNYQKSSKNIKNKQTTKYMDDAEKWDHQSLVVEMQKCKMVAPSSKKKNMAHFHTKSQVKLYV